ncbi:MAG: pyridoxal phosphate-dependent aminotransferase [Fusobacteriaceae bacterium]
MLAINRETIHFEDKVFSTANRSRLAIEEFGKDKVINATLGTLFCEDQKLVVFSEVVETYRELENTEIFGYAKGITGDQDFKLAVKTTILGEDFQEVFKSHFIEAISTAGGTGALSNSLKTYVHKGEKVLLPNLMWEPYKVIVKNAGGIFDTYRLFNSENSFDLENFKEKVLTLSKIQKSLAIIINDPCHNPTGYKLNSKEWKEVIEILKSASKFTNIVLIKDIAYSDFDFQTEQEKKDHLNLFKDLPENFLTIFSFSISKSLTSYGLRVGAQLAISKSEKVIKDFIDASNFICRATWSNISAGGMKMFNEIVFNKDKSFKVLKEREKYIFLLKERSEIFLIESNIIGLKTYPYKSGFFITIPLDKPSEKVVFELEKENIFTIPLDNNLRIAICSLSKEKIKGLAKKIQIAILKA